MTYVVLLKPSELALMKSCAPSLEILDRLECAPSARQFVDAYLEKAFNKKVEEKAATVWLNEVGD